jgi:hypothetical protein
MRNVNVLDLKILLKMTDAPPVYHVGNDSCTPPSVPHSNDYRESQYLLGARSYKSIRVGWSETRANIRMILIVTFSFKSKLVDALTAATATTAATALD